MWGETRNLKYKICVYLACEEGPGICAHLLTLFSMLLIFLSLPISLCFVVKVVQVYILDIIISCHNLNFFYQTLLIQIKYCWATPERKWTNYMCGKTELQYRALCSIIIEAEFKEFEPRFKVKPRLTYGWFYLKLYSIFQDLSRRSFETGFLGIWDAA